MGKGKFIVLEGIDGSGKSTLAERVASLLENSVCLREPTTGQYGKKIREKLSGTQKLDPEEMLELFILDRREDCEQNIVPALLSGKNIVMDRYFYSNAAYQGAMGLDPGRIVERNIMEGFPVPDIVLFVKIHPEEAINRISGRGGKSEQYEKLSFLTEVDKVFGVIADNRFVFLDGTLPRTQLAEKAMEEVSKVL